MMGQRGSWWCMACKEERSDEHVIDQEKCACCGQPIIWVTINESKVVDDLRRRLGEAEKEKQCQAK